ncbi:DUF6318 family protein [Zafaria sp. J156]|uniref:DUF6318 family protein n=1 Tax=Zafaria sp. J156 TaxID=3116490 RepID=UPI002E79B623|nr:DUF6318 family protein [Zafaria sp. J156]MEE1620065.1 DUF6318 family protein [Zafaria sp. J156]
MLSRSIARSRLLAVPLAVALLAAGCAGGGEAEPGSPETSSGAAPTSSAALSSSAAPSSASPTPVPASSTGPAENWPVPEMPAEAKEQTAEGLKAFVEYYFDLINYTGQTQDSAPLKAVTSRSCELCATAFIDVADLNKEAGAWIVGGEHDVTVFTSHSEEAGTGIATFGVVVAPMTIYNSDGTLNGEAEEEEDILGAISTEFDDGWTVVGFDVSEDS